MPAGGTLIARMDAAISSIQPTRCRGADQLYPAGPTAGWPAVGNNKATSAPELTENRWAANASDLPGDQRGAFLADHDRRCMRTCIECCRHDRSVDDTQAFDAVDAQLWIDDRGRLGTHAAGAARMEVCRGCGRGYPPRSTRGRWRSVRERALLRSGGLSLTRASCRASAVPTAPVHANPRARRNIPGRSADALLGRRCATGYVRG